MMKLKEWIAFSRANKAFFFVSLLAIHIVYLLISTELEKYLGIGEIDLEDIEEIKANITEFFFYAVILAPVLEEIVYRLPLKKSRWAYLAIPLGLAVLSYDSLWLGLLDGFYLLTVLFFLLFSFRWSRKLVIAGSILAFTITHAVNYSTADLQSMHASELVLLFDAQLILALVATYLRIIYGFPWALGYHALYNFIVFWIGWYTM